MNSLIFKDLKESLIFYRRKRLAIKKEPKLILAIKSTFWGFLNSILLTTPENTIHMSRIETTMGMFWWMLSIQYALLSLHTPSVSWKTTYGGQKIPKIYLQFFKSTQINRNIHHHWQFSHRFWISPKIY